MFLDPWWMLGPGHEVTANKRLWDLGAELVENIPHSLEVSTYDVSSLNVYALLVNGVHREMITQYPAHDTRQQTNIKRKGDLQL